MTELPSDAIGGAFTSDTAWSTVEKLTAIGNRMSGQDGERTAGDVLVARFEEVGLRDIRTTEFEIPGWWRGSTSLTVRHPHDRTFANRHEVNALPGTPPCDLDAEIVDLGYGLPEDFTEADLEEKLALVSSWVPGDYGRWVHRQEKYANAVDAGAAGFLFRNHVDGGVPPTGFISFGGSAAEIPGVGLSKEVGDRLGRVGERGTSVALSVDCRSGDATSRNIEAVIGPDSETAVVVGAHYDAHDVGEGAGDNGSGVAILLEVGRMLAQVEDELESTVRLVGFGAEEAGMIGSDHWVDANDLDAVECMLNLDGIGDSRTLRLYPNGFDAIEDAVEAACADLAVPYAVEDGIFCHGDQWPFVRRGVPAAMVGSGSMGRVANAHTHTDTIDKIDRRDLRDLAICVTNCVLRLAEAERELESVSPEEVRARIDDETRIGLKRQGRWPWED